MNAEQQRLLDHLFEDNSYFVRAFEPEQQQFILQHMRRQDYQSSSFLNERLHAADDLIYLLPMRDTLAQFKGKRIPSRPLHFIFHFALCGSTLLSRCLDHPGHTLVYKEPELLHQLSTYKRWPLRNALPEASLLAFAYATLQRTAVPSETPIVKLTDSCSNLVKDCLSVHAQTRGIVLYSTLERFLTATLKTQRRRRFIRGMYKRAVNDLMSLGMVFDTDHDTLSDAETSGLVWLSLMYRYRQWLTLFDGQLCSLPMQQWLDQPVEVLQRITTFMSLKLPDALIRETVQTGAFTRNAKVTTQPFDRNTYAEKEIARRRQLTDEIAAGKAWVAAFTAHHPISQSLPFPLLP